MKLDKLFINECQSILSIQYQALFHVIDRCPQHRVVLMALLISLGFLTHEKNESSKMWSFKGIISPTSLHLPTFYKGFAVTVVFVDVWYFLFSIFLK